MHQAMLIAAALCSSAAATACAHIARRRRHQGQEDCCQQGSAAAAAESNEAFIVWDEPAKQYTPANPRWLAEAAAWSLPDAATGFKACPLLHTLEDLPLPEPGTHECRDALFRLDPDVAYLNHGSYGATFRACLDVQSWYRDLMESQPVQFMETTAMQGLVLAAADVASFIGAKPCDVLPVANATSACNAVIASVAQAAVAATTAPSATPTTASSAATAPGIRQHLHAKQHAASPSNEGSSGNGSRGLASSGDGPASSGRFRDSRLPLWRWLTCPTTWIQSREGLTTCRIRGSGSSSNGGDRRAILITTLTYPAVKSAVVAEAQRAGLSVVVVQLGLKELTQTGLALQAVQQAARRYHGRLLLAVLDHVVSFPPVVLPVEAMVEACKQAGAWVLVDGAHAISHLPKLNVPAIGAHFYTSNLHKWCCCPKGTAFLWADASTHKDTSRPTITTHGPRPNSNRKDAPGQSLQSRSVPTKPQTCPAGGSNGASASPVLQSLNLRPTVTSHGFGLGARAEFLWQGTEDVTGWLAVPAALKLLRRLGPERVARHNARLVREAAWMLRQRWGTHLQVLGGEVGCTSEQLLGQVTRSAVAAPVDQTSGQIAQRMPDSATAAPTPTAARSASACGALAQDQVTPSAVDQDTSSVAIAAAATTTAKSASACSATAEKQVTPTVERVASKEGQLAPEGAMKVATTAQAPAAHGGGNQTGKAQEQQHDAVQGHAERACHDADATVGCMLVLELPHLAGQPQPATVDFAIHIHDVLRLKHKIEIPVACVGSRLWVRLSAQMYNTLADYERLASVVDSMRADACKAAAA